MAKSGTGGWALFLQGGCDVPQKLHFGSIDRSLDEGISYYLQAEHPPPHSVPYPPQENGDD